MVISEQANQSMDKFLRKKIKASTNWEELRKLLKTLQFCNLSPRDVGIIFKSIERLKGDDNLSIAYLSNHTIDQLPSYVSLNAFEVELQTKHYVGPYNQYFQEVLDTSTEFHNFDPDIVYLDLSINNLAPNIYYEYLNLTNKDREIELSRILELAQKFASIIKQKTNAYLLLGNFVQPSYCQAGIADHQLELGESEWYLKLNLSLIQTFKNDNRIFIVDKNNALAKIGKDNSCDETLRYLAKIELNEKALFALSSEIVRYIFAIKGLTKKCLVLDLDNTLWGGVIGEDGINGIKIGKGFPEGEIYYELQKFSLSLKHRGILLAISSKNNSDDVIEVFNKKADMPLSLEDFAITRINWNPKNQSIQEIAQSLNIGINSFVFVDDNPVERQLIKNSLPDVHVPEMPEDSTHFLNTIRSITAFDKLFITDEDKNKLEQYKENTKRHELQHEVTDISEFIASLGTEVTVFRASSDQLPRIHQLFVKTNQFNVTTKRYSVAEIENFITSANFHLFGVSVKDNFGDLGIVGLILINITGDEKASIDSFILSCRAMGRNIETVMMNTIKDKFLQTGKIHELSAAYIPTTKNIPVLMFFETQAFSCISTNENGIKTYNLDAAHANIIECPGIKLISGE